VRRARSRFASFTGPREHEPIPRTPSRPRRQRYSRGVLFFLPAFLTQSHDMDMTPYQSSTQIPHIQPVPLHRSSSPSVPPEKRRHVEDIELGSNIPETNYRSPHRPSSTYESRSSPYASTSPLVDVDIGQTSSASRT